ncbi:MAG: DUF4255 domain-containing protein [Pelatocladus maniniholoensis HA4357-MV3]|jgi:hypothetical protein|uniref:DUF4255 domain-containing protein n=1 Tax=Pelatocladus maniniholoensis HA4357-MV3 TaxID=1117104 RepID=A0A9E3HCT9_9NOST|nr:DUF4255 domain-containing protein [Pelatocladus maniniholoensis HA4357-MV3]BAZ70713.1 hypothetical protein NIES4106_55100 [Fischerella sp. NIES-4106]
MIDDLDLTLEELLKRSLPPDLVRQVSISFATPDPQFPPSSVTLPAINLFLYDVRENRELRNNEWLVERQSNGNAIKKPPLVRVDCSYLITAWTSQTSPTPIRDEHRLLGEVIKVLLRYPTLPSEVLQGNLVEQELPLPTMSLQATQLQSIGEFWQALGGKPKAVLNYTVTMSVVAQEPLTTPLATESQINT